MKDFFQSDKRIFPLQLSFVETKAIHSFSRKKNGKKNVQKTCDLLKNQHINCYQIVTNKRHIQRKRVICVSLEEEKKKRETEKKP